VQSTSNRSGWKVMVLATTIMVGGCENATSERPGGARMLTMIEMEQVTVGSAGAMNEVEAHAFGSAPQTSSVTSTLADSGGSPIAGAPFLNYSTSQAVASASDGPLVQVGGSSQILVDSSGGARINAVATGTAAGSEASEAELNIQFTGISLSHLDLAYGTISATACCNPRDGTQAEADSRGGGPYTSELQGAPISNVPAQVQSRIDAAVASSTLPLLDAGQALTVTAPRPWQSINQ
jgi:hypothetical protein